MWRKDRKVEADFENYYGGRGDWQTTEYRRQTTDDMAAIGDSKGWTGKFVIKKGSGRSSVPTRTDS